MLTALLSGAGLGLLSVPHCAAMCGPLAQAACSRSAQRTAPLQYQAGRVVGYAFVGALSGHLGSALSMVKLASWLPLLLAVATSSALIAMAWRIQRAAQPASTKPASTPLIQLRLSTTKPEPSLWSRMQSLLPAHPAVFGMSTAMLPCGALAAALLLSANYAAPTPAALSMAGFAVATAPATFAVAWLMQRLPQLRSPRLLRVASLALVVVALGLVARPIARIAASPTSGTSPNAAETHCH